MAPLAVAVQQKAEPNLVNRRQAKKTKEGEDGKDLRMGKDDIFIAARVAPP